MHRLIYLVAAAVSSFLFLSASYAENLNTVARGDALTARDSLTTTRSLGVANAMVSSGAGTSAVWHNPAAITSATMYSVDAGYIYDHSVGGHGVEVNVVDMKSNQYVGAGIGFVYEYGAGSQHLISTRLGLAVPLADNLISLGVTGVYSYIKRHDKKVLSQFTMDAGLVVRPISWLAIGFSAQNLIVGDYKAYMPRMITAGISAGSIDYGFNVMFDVSFDISADDIAKTGGYAVGVEYVLKRLVPIRAGYRYEGEDHHVISCGLGYRDDSGRFGLDLAYQHHFDDYTSEIFSGSFGVYF